MTETASSRGEGGGRVRSRQAHDPPPSPQGLPRQSSEKDRVSSSSQRRFADISTFKHNSSPEICTKGGADVFDQYQDRNIEAMRAEILPPPLSGAEAVLNGAVNNEMMSQAIMRALMDSGRKSFNEVPLWGEDMTEGGIEADALYETHIFIKRESGGGAERRWVPIRVRAKTSPDPVVEKSRRVLD